MTRVIIDDFNTTSTDGPLIVTPGDPGPKSLVEGADSGILGGYRSATMSYLAGTELVQYVVSDGYCSFAFGAAASQAQLTILWSANGSGLDLDLSQHGKLFIDLGIDHPAAPITLTIHSQGMTYHLQRSATDQTTLDFPLSEFFPVPGAAALADITAIEMSIDGRTTIDITLDQIGAD